MYSNTWHFPVFWKPEFLGWNIQNRNVIQQWLSKNFITWMKPEIITVNSWNICICGCVHVCKYRYINTWSSQLRQPTSPRNHNPQRTSFITFYWTISSTEPWGYNHQNPTYKKVKAKCQDLQQINHNRKNWPERNLRFRKLTTST